MDSTAIRANKNSVRRIDIDGALLTTVGAFSVAGIAHKSAEDLLMLLLDGSHAGNGGMCEKVEVIEGKFRKVGRGAVTRPMVVGVEKDNTLIIIH
jgi:hypothetical protein